MKRLGIVLDASWKRLESDAARESLGHSKSIVVLKEVTTFGNLSQQENGKRAKVKRGIRCRERVRARGSEAEWIIDIQ